eukprot:808832_1
MAIPNTSTINGTQSILTASSLREQNVMDRPNNVFISLAAELIWKACQLFCTCCPEIIYRVLCSNWITMSQFLSKTIDSIFCKYDDNYISPSVKRFLSECIIQLINVSLLSINTNHQESKNQTGLTLFHSSSNHTKQRQLNSYSKQMSLLTEWLENFIEPSHISMFTQTIIHIIRQLQGTVSYNNQHNRHHIKHSVSRQSMSTTPNDLFDSMDFVTTPDIDPPQKKSRISLFNNKSKSTNDEEKYPPKNAMQRTSLTANSQASEILQTTQPLQPQQSTNSEDIHLHMSAAQSMNLDWAKYETMSFILIRSLTSILNQSLKRYNNKTTVIFDDQFDKIIDDVIQFLFSRLTLEYSDNFRGIIGDCLGVVSRKYLNKICESILGRWKIFGDSKRQKANDIKKFAILHRAVKYLEFDIYGSNRGAAIDYLTHLCIRMQLTEKKILREQICHSLVFIFDSISPQKEDENDEEEDRKEEQTANKPFIRLCPKETDSEFWTLYYTIFNIVEQWSHKKGCTVFCYELIIKMMCCGNLPFYLHVLKYQPKSKSGYILPSLHRNKATPKMVANHHHNASLENATGSISALPDTPSKSPIIKFLISNLSHENTKRNTLRIILQFIQELPEEFVMADNEWYAKLLHYLEDKIIYNSNPEQAQELKIIASIFTAFAERDGKSYFVPAVQRLLLGNPWWNRIGLETLHHAVVAFGHTLSRYNFTLGACLSPFVRGTKGQAFQQLALQCWPIIRSPRNSVEDIHNEVMQMVQLIKNKKFARLAADNLINYVEIDFENHLIPVVSSLLSPMRDFERFKEDHLRTTIDVLSQIVHRLIKHLEYLEEYEGYYYWAQKGAMRTQNHSDSEYDETIGPEEEKSHEFGSMNNMVDAVLNDNDRKQLHLPMSNLNSIHHDQSVEYDDANQEFYRVKNALSLIEMWPHIRLLIEGYVLLWYLHPDEYIRDQLYELLSLIRHTTIINNIDPTDGPPSIYEQIQRYNSRHHKNDGYSNSGGVNMGTGTSSGASQSGLSNYSNERNDPSVRLNVKKQLYLSSPLPQRHAFEDDQYQIAHQFPPELERLIFKKRKFFEGLLNWVFLRTTPQLDTFFNQISGHFGVGEDVSLELYDNDEFVLMKHRWELMCLSVRIDETYYQQTNDDKYIASFHRAKSNSFDKFDNKYGYNKYNGFGAAASSPHKRYTTQSSTNSSHHKQSVIVHHPTKGREVSQSNTVVINTAVSKLQHRVFNTDDTSLHHAQDTAATTIHHKQDTANSMGVEDVKKSEPPNISVTGDDLAVQDLISSIKFSRAISSMTPTKTDLQVAKNRLRLIGRPSARRDKELGPIDDDNTTGGDKKKAKAKKNQKTDKLKTAKTRKRIPSTSKESLQQSPPEIDMKAHALLVDGVSPNGSPLPAPLMQGDSGNEESHTDEEAVLKSMDTMDDDDDVEYAEEEESKWNESEEEEKGDVVGPLLKDKSKKKRAKKRSKEKHHQQVHYSEDVQFENESENENIYNYHREQISMFLVPMTDIRIPKRMLNQFLDKIISFTLAIQSAQDDEVLDSIFEPIQRMDVVVSELLIERLFRTAFGVDALPHSQNDSNYNEWRLNRLQHFYFHAPTLHLLSIIFTNRGIMNYDYSSSTFHHPSNEFAISLDKVMIATIYLVEVKELTTMRCFETVLYLLILMRQFFYFYRNEEAKFRYHPFLDIAGKEHGKDRVLLMKKPRPLSNMKMRRNLLEFIQCHMSPIADAVRKEMKKLEERHGIYRHGHEEAAINSPDYKRLVYLYGSIETALAECILGLIELGPIGEKPLEMELLKELEKYICKKNDKLKAIAQNGMNAVFKHNSHLLEHFIQQSCKLHLYYNEFVVGSQNTIQTSSNTHHRHNRNDKNITLISLAYLTSLVYNFQSVDMIGLNPISALVLCMLHQCSPHQQARNLALKLAKYLAKFNYDPGAKFLFETTTSSPDKYLKFAFDYSSAISALRPEIVPQIMFEVVRFYDRVESEYDREILLRLLPWWVSQFSTVSAKIAVSEMTSCREMTYAFIVKLYELTARASKSPNQSSKQLTLSYRLWCHLALSTPDDREAHFDDDAISEMLISEIVSYIISRYTLHYVEECVICESILEKICIECYKRTSSAPLLCLAKCLGESLHRYPDKFPLEPVAFNQYKVEQMAQKKNKKDIIKSTERSAFKLIHRLLDCKIVNPFEKYIPLLLQNAAVINKNTFDDIVLRLAKYFQIDKRKRRRSKTKKIKNEEDYGQFEGISFWKKYNPKMCIRWSDLAISWALQANKPHITMYSVDVFDALNSYVLNYDLLVRLSLITYHCIKQGNYPTALFTIIIKILQKSLHRSELQHKKWKNDEYKIALSLCYILLSLQHESIHKAALTFWNKFLSSDAPQHAIVGSMHRVLSFNKRNTKAMDQVIAQQLQHSLAREELFEVSVNMVEKLCCLLCHHIPAAANKLLHLTVLSHMLRIQIIYTTCSNANCDRLISVLSHYKRECAEMIQQCRKIRQYSDFSEFLTDTCKIYFKLFPSKPVFRGGLSALCKFIEYGSKLWYVAVLNIIEIILNVTESQLIDAAQFKQISNILVLASYLSPIRITKPPPINTAAANKKRKSSTTNNLKVGHKKKEEKEEAIIIEEEEEEEFINLTPLVSRIALKLTQRAQLRLPQDQKFLFQFIDPLPESLDRIWREMQQIQLMNQSIINQQQKSHAIAINFNKRLVLSCEEEKKCEEDTVKRLQDFLLPMLTKAIRSNHAARHMRSGSILNFGIQNTAAAAAKENTINKKEQKAITIKKPSYTSHSPFNSNASYLSTHSVLIQNTPSVDTDDDDDNLVTPQLYNNASCTPEPNQCLNDDEESEDDQSVKYNVDLQLDEVDEEEDDEEEEEESKQIEYHGESEDDIDDDEFRELDEDLLIQNIEKSQTVHVHKQHSTKDYGQFGYGEVAKDRHNQHAIQIKVEQMPSKAVQQQQKKKKKKQKSKSKKRRKRKRNYSEMRAMDDTDSEDEVIV